MLTQSASGLAVELHPKRKGTRPSKAAPIVPRASLTVPADAPQPSLARPQSAPILRAPPTSLQSASVGGRSARPNSAHVHKRKPPSRRPTEAWGPGPPTPLVRWAMRAPPPLPPPPPPSLPKGRLADLAWTIMRPGDAAGASRARDAPDLTSEARQPPSPASPLPPTPPLHPSSPALPCPALPSPLPVPSPLPSPRRNPRSPWHLPSRPHLGLISASSRPRQVGRLLAAGEDMAEAIAREARGEPPQSAYLTMLDRLRSDPATGSKQQLLQQARAAPHRPAPRRTAPHRAAPRRTAPHRAAVHRAASSNAPPRLSLRSVGRSSSTSTALRRRVGSSGPRQRTRANMATPARAVSLPLVRRAPHRTWLR